MRFVRLVFTLCIIAVVVGGPLWYLSYRRANFRNFRTVTEGVLYRSGQLSRKGLERAIQEKGIRTVVTLRYAVRPGDRPPDADEEEYCQHAGLNYCRIPYRPWWASDGTVPAEKGVKDFLRIMQDPANYPVLVHCFAGIHRTGAYCALYRMEFDRWSNDEAIEEMRRNGYLDEHLDVLTYLENYGHADQSYPGRRMTLPANHHTERDEMSK